MKSYLAYEMGNINILLSAPHGGNKRPKDILIRKKGKKTKDTYTKSLTKKLIQLYNMKNENPYYIVSCIHRNRIDLNREIKEATEYNEKVIEIWNEWNDTLSKYKYHLLSTYKKGLYIDVHSHNNSDEFQLGYNLSTSNYNNILKGENIRGSTLDSLNHSLGVMLFGRYSIKNSLENYGFKVFSPRKGEEYFNGGYNVETFSGNGLGGIQIEVPVIELKRNINSVTNSLFNSIEIFRKAFI